MKQAIVVRSDLGMGTGKLAAQVAHASLQAFQRASTAVQNTWTNEGATKVVLQVEGEDELMELATRARTSDIPHATVKDAGRTQLAPGTRTALGIGPAPDEDVDTVT
ncbi:MAG: peptidyl-tRNA hydrolase Pth2, partial [Halobacteriaceae archaeon]